MESPGNPFAFDPSLGERVMPASARLPKPVMPSDPFDGMEPSTLEDDPAFERLLSFMEAQNRFLESELESFRGYVEESHRADARAERASRVSLAISAASLIVAVATLAISVAAILLP